VLRIPRTRRRDERGKWQPTTTFDWALGHPSTKFMVVMSNYLNQSGKENLNNPVFVSSVLATSPPNLVQASSIESVGVNKPGLNTAQPVATAHIGSGMPEPYMSAGGYYTNTNGFALSFPNYNQPAQWSTGTNNPQAPPQTFEHSAMQYSTLNAAPAAQTNPDVTQNQLAQNHQFVAADHLFSQNNSAYQSAFSAPPYMNGNWSYFNNPNSFFFPTGNGDLNLTWGTTGADNPNSALYDLYKHPLPPMDQDKAKVEPSSTNELTNGFENVETSKSVDSVEQTFSAMTVNAPEKDVEPIIENSVAPSLPPSNTPVAIQKVSPPTPPVSTGQSNAPAKPVSWAAVASQPAKSKPPAKKPPPKTQAPAQSAKNGFSTQNGTGAATANKGKQQPGSRWSNRQPQQQQQLQNGNNCTNVTGDVVAVPNDSHININRLKEGSELLKKLMAKYNFNPRELNLDQKNARFFIIKSYSEDDIFRSIKYSSWTSTEHGNRRLNEAFKEQQKQGKKTPMYLLFSVNSSGHFCGVAEMKSEVDLNVETGIWVQDKWKGRFDVRWIYVKDVPNNTLRHIRLENNENKPVTNSRDTQEVHPEKAKQVLKIIHNYKAQTSIFDDFDHYEKRQEEDARMRSKKMPEPDL